jgi:hypothetical protein
MTNKHYDTQQNDTQYDCTQHVGTNITIKSGDLEKLNDILSVVIIHYAGCRYAGCHFVVCRYAGCHYAVCHFAVFCYAVCH